LQVSCRFIAPGTNRERKQHEYRRQLEKGISPDGRSASEDVDSVRQQVIQVVERYMDAVRRNDASALPLHPDAVCEFPTNTYRGAASFRQGLDQFAQIMKSIDVIRLVVDGEHCVAILNIDTVFGPIPFAEWRDRVDPRLL
jgi:hypothetical protein